MGAFAGPTINVLDSFWTGNGAFATNRHIELSNPAPF